MLTYNNYYKIQLFLIIIFTLLLFGCNKKSTKISNNEPIDEKTDSSTLLVKVNNLVFSIPSPQQAYLFIRKNGIKFNKELINDINNISKYTTSTKKALNIGILGSDLAYLNVFEQIPEAVQYFTSIKKLAIELGIFDSFDQELIDKIENNLSNKDTLMICISKIYENINAYLKNNQRNGTGMLIIAGGWIESLYILTQATISTGNYEIRNKVGEQKYPLDNLIELLSPYYYYSEDFTQLIDKLIDLAYDFDGVIYNYDYEQPVIDTIKKTTIIRSESKVIISEYHLNVISEKISQIRNEIIN
jgi:hypothetical protein